MLKKIKVIERDNILLLPLFSKNVIKPLSKYAINMLIRIGAKIPPKK